MIRRAVAALVALGTALAPAAEDPLRISVYATAGGVNRYLATPQDRDQVVDVLRRFRVSRVFLEGRRGDEYVPPETLRELRDYFAGHGIRTTGAIATVPGKQFGVRQNEKLGWLNFEADQTRRDLARFFSENAAVFDELIVDDFYCTGDTTPASERARGNRSWAQYRQDLLVSLIEPLLREPARAARPSVRLILKYPQWYDRFHRFGYDPARMSPLFDQIWVGTEVRNPLTPRMGFVQPTEGYINFRWLSAVAGQKVHGAWFDHIECTAQNFVDQAWQSVLAGAPELTLFHLGDLMEGHPGHALFLRDLDSMRELAVAARHQPRRGVPYYKPPGSDGDQNLYLMDYLAMLGIPVIPTAQYPGEAPVVVLGTQAADDPSLLEQMRRHLRAGATLVVTPALLDKLGPEGARLAGAGKLRPSPRITSRRSGAGRLLVWNVRTFSEQDYRDTGEWLLAPKPLDLVDLPKPLIDDLRNQVLAPLGLRLSAPARVALYLLGDRHILYNFRDQPVEVRLGRETIRLHPHALTATDY